jgi:multiple sugar transport system ATP-binding protein
MASVAIENVRKAYGSVAVVHGVFVVLLGPSGCGKSTLLRMVAGLEKITSGEIKIGGRVVNDMHPKDRDIAMMFQNYALYAHMNVFNNMSFAMNLKKAPQSEIDKQVKWAASILGLEPYLQRFPRQLSGGQRQRVAMGRAIVRNPGVFLFDEPRATEVCAITNGRMEAPLKLAFAPERAHLFDAETGATLRV